jgi:hypothetical protein
MGSNTNLRKKLVIAHAWYRKKRKGIEAHPSGGWW